MRKQSLLCDSIHFTRGLNFHRRFWKKDHYRVVIDRLLEEMSELQKVVLKERRGREVQDHIKEEFADVLMCLEYLARAKGYKMSEMIKVLEMKTDKMIENLKTGRG